MTAFPDTTGVPPRRVAVLGSTGSIGRSTLDVARAWPSRVRIVALAACRSDELLLEQALEFEPEVVALVDPASARRFRERWPRGGKRAPLVLEGEDAVLQIARMDGLDLLVNGLVGSLGLEPTLDALGRGTSVAIANKEPLVVAGQLVMDAARASGAEFLPLDSELSAIHQCLRGNSGKSVERIILTASGGPFRTRPAATFDAITVEDALDHPVWDMGPKVTVDSATLMNKGLEILETHRVFDVPIERIEVVVHPQSLVHSFVEFVDRSVMAQISEPDMRLPIQYAMTYPERLASRVEPLDLVSAGQLTFEPPDIERFPCLRLARDAGRAGGAAPCALNAANEVAVQAFLERRIRFTDIPHVIEGTLERCAGPMQLSLEAVRRADALAREEAARRVDERAASPVAARARR
jgi:1-deoxy-D-xylulose-5-phosphate reductoisomerase